MTKYEFVESWFKRNANVRFSNSELEKRLREDYSKEVGGEFRDPLREVRKAYERGLIKRTPKGPHQVYWFGR